MLINLINLKLFPVEKEHPRVNYVGIKNYSDPLTSFLKLLLGFEKSKTIDGRRMYTMVVNEKEKMKKSKTTKISISDYVNIWTDHKRNDLKYIEITQKLEHDFLAMPSSMKIKFKGFLFKLKEY